MPKWFVSLITHGNSVFVQALLVKHMSGLHYKIHFTAGTKDRTHFPVAWHWIIQNLWCSSKNSNNTSQSNAFTLKFILLRLVSHKLAARVRLYNLEKSFYSSDDRICKAMSKASSFISIRLALLIICVAPTVALLENSPEDDYRSDRQYIAEYVKFIGDYSDEQFQQRPTRILIHGCKSCQWVLSSAHRGSISSSYDFNDVSRAYKANHADAFNVITLEWRSGSVSYRKNREYIRNRVAISLVQYLHNKIGSNQNMWKSLKIIGHSLGAHAAGFAGQLVSRGRIGSIIGLDPASI